MIRIFTSTRLLVFLLGYWLQAKNKLVAIMRAVIAIGYFIKRIFMSPWIYLLLGVAIGFVLTIVIEYYITKHYVEKLNYRDKEY